MTSRASAPGKVILFGEHFVVYGGGAILCSIDKRVLVTSKTIEEKVFSIKSDLGELKKPITVSINKIDSPLKPFFYIAKKMSEQFNYKGGIEVVINSDIPSGVGLGSSSACCVACASSISNLFSKLSKDELLDLAIKAEQTIFKDTSGADCTVCTYGGIIKYNKKTGFKKILGGSDFILVIANSGTTHVTNLTVEKVKKFKEDNVEEFSALAKKEFELIEKVEIALHKNDLTSLGKSMIENQSFLEEIGVSNQQLNTMIELTNKTSYGAKITGAGDGGCIIAIVDKSNLEGTIKNLRNKNFECFSAKIDSKGLDTF